MTLAEAQSVLAAAGVRFAAGMTADEFARVEQRFGFRFPLDLREFLAAGLPVSEGWVDWRGEDEATILDSLNWPLEGICFDIERNGFWLPEWGARPPGLPDAFEVARRAVAPGPGARPGPRSPIRPVAPPPNPATPSNRPRRIRDSRYAPPYSVLVPACGSKRRADRRLDRRERL